MNFAFENVSNFEKIPSFLKVLAIAKKAYDWKYSLDILFSKMLSEYFIHIYSIRQWLIFNNSE